MRKIHLSEDFYAHVDDEDYEVLCKYKWRVSKNGNNYYAIKNNRRESMHRIIMNNPDGLVDHIDGNGLNNQRKNLRVCTHQQNIYNQKPQVGCSSTYKGVHWHKTHRKWVARIKKDGVKKHLGYFEDEKKAALAYDEAAKKLFGEFARPNFS